MRFSRYVSACLHDRKDEVLKVHTFRTRMEMERFELLTPCLQGRCSPN